MIFQDPLSHLNPVYHDRLAARRGLQRPRRRRRARRRATRRSTSCGRVGIREPEKRIDQYPHQFSGGQRQRIMIGMAIALRPEILIADEPTTALDVSVQAQILDLLKKLQAEDGLAIILITHDLEVAANMADRVIVMKSGRIVEEGEARAVFENPKHSYTRHADQRPAARRSGQAAAAGRQAGRQAHSRSQEASTSSTPLVRVLLQAPAASRREGSELRRRGGRDDRHRR